MIGKFSLLSPFRGSSLLLNLVTRGDATTKTRRIMKGCMLIPEVGMGVGGERSMWLGKVDLVDMNMKIFKGPFKVCLKLGDIAAAPARLTW